MEWKKEAMKYRYQRCNFVIVCDSQLIYWGRMKYNILKKFQEKVTFHIL